MIRFCCKMEEIGACNDIYVWREEGEGGGGVCLIPPEFYLWGELVVYV